MSGHYEPVGRKRDATATRLAILAAAQQLFAERGYERATVREIAARAGVNQAAATPRGAKLPLPMHVQVCTLSAVAYRYAALPSWGFPWRYPLPTRLVLHGFPAGSFLVAPQLGEDVSSPVARFASAARFRAALRSRSAR